MKISFILTDDDGRQFEGTATVSPLTKKPKKSASSHPRATSRQSHLSFTLNIRAFLRKYARGLGGPQKFTLLLARLAKGATSVEVPAGDIRKQWNKAKAIMGGEFNTAHSNRAKENGWVDSPKHGVYRLSDSWTEVHGANHDS